MGRAIVRDPKVFLFDEPLSNLDAKLRVQMRTEIKKVHQKVRTTTVYVTHDQVEAMTLADRVVVMNAGLIEQVGTPNDLYHSPATKFVAGFIGSPAMNFIPCQLEQAARRAATCELNDKLAFPVPDGRTARYSAYVGKPNLVLGLRPEHITETRPHSRAEPARLRADDRGGRADGHGDAGLLHHQRRRGLRPGQSQRRRTAERSMKLRADLSNMHLIDDTTGKVL